MRNTNHLLHCILAMATSAHHLHVFTDPAATEIDTLSLHDALPISHRFDHDAHVRTVPEGPIGEEQLGRQEVAEPDGQCGARSEEHTSELQSLAYLVCRLLLEKTKFRNFKTR